MSAKLIHGGDLESASQYFDIDIDDWLDLSTGINPCGYPIGAIDERSFRQMPYQSAAFHDAVSRYYLSSDRYEQSKNMAPPWQFIATNGSQQTIALLPKMLMLAPVLLPDLGYEEHAESWRRNGNTIKEYSAMNLEIAREKIEQVLASGKAHHVVVINPNNPSGLCFEPEELLRWAKLLKDGCKLIIDEAFIDASSTQSVLPFYYSSNMIVLRSFGKFFGLAGLRLGFVFTAEDFAKQLREFVGVWDVNGPAQSIAMCALNDESWQKDAFKNVHENAGYNRELLEPLLRVLEHQTPEVSRIVWARFSDLFSSICLNAGCARLIHDSLARRGILIRLINISEKQSLIRFGQFNYQNSNDVERFSKAISEVSALVMRATSDIELNELENMNE